MAFAEINMSRLPTPAARLPHTAENSRRMRKHTLIPDNVWLPEERGGRKLYRVRRVSTYGVVRRSHYGGCETLRISHRAADHIRADHQPEDREDKAAA
jgi:hypothetical protein